jgi:hypothetical protein
MRLYTNVDVAPNWQNSLKKFSRKKTSDFAQLERRKSNRSFP